MDIKFKNKYTRNRELAKEIYGYYYFKRKLYVFADVLLAISFTVNLIGAVVGDSYSLYVFIAAPLMAALQVFLYFYQVNMMIKRDHELAGKDVDIETVVTDELIQGASSTGTVNKITFDKVKGVVQTKNLIMLGTKANMIYIFHKDGFEIGNAEEFIAFLRNKGFSVKGKKA